MFNFTELTEYYKVVDSLFLPFFDIMHKIINIILYPIITITPYVNQTNTILINTTATITAYTLPFTHIFNRLFEIEFIKILVSIAIILWILKLLIKRN